MPFDSIRLAADGLLLELSPAGGEPRHLPVKYLRPDALEEGWRRPETLRLQPDWACEHAEIRGDSVRLLFGDGKWLEVPQERLAEMAGLETVAGKQPDLVLLNAGWLVQCRPDKGEPEARLGLVRGGAVAIRSGRISDVGTTRDLKERYASAKTRLVWIDGLGVAPALVDPHTHLVFAGDRAEEFALRAKGLSYLEIAKRGGGILSTVRATREASDEELARLAFARMSRAGRWGTGSMEAKSGYALEVEGELRLCRLSQRVGLVHPVDTQPTLLAAHVVPPEFRADREAYVHLVTEEILPRAAQEGVATACDVFCEEGAFTVEEARRILERARDLGLALHVHAEQFTETGASALAAELGALSTDHLEAAGPATVQALRDSATVAVLLPGAALAASKHFPDGRALRDAGVRVALGTDLNPGTSHTESLPVMMSLACGRCGLTVEEAWLAVTADAAQAAGLPDRGRLVPGAPADLVLLEASHPAAIPYHLGGNRLRALVKRGHVLPTGETLT